MKKTNYQHISKFCLLRSLKKIIGSKDIESVEIFKKPYTLKIPDKLAKK